MWKTFCYGHPPLCDSQVACLTESRVSQWQESWQSFHVEVWFVTIMSVRCDTDTDSVSLSWYQYNLTMISHALPRSDWQNGSYCCHNITVTSNKVTRRWLFTYVLRNIHLLDIRLVCRVLISGLIYMPKLLQEFYNLLNFKILEAA